MKKLIFMTLFIFSSISFSQLSNSVISGWLWQNPYLTGNNLRSIALAIHSYYAGDHGTMLRSTDNGITFQTLDLNTEDDIIDVHAVNNNTLVALLPYFESFQFKGKIMRSSDAGNSWNTVLTNQPQLNDADANQDIVIAVGETGIIVKSTDAGQTFAVIQNNPVSDFKGVTFPNGAIFVCGTNGKIYKSTNGGTTITEQVSNTSNKLNKIHAFDNNNAKAVGDNGTVVKTTNGGINWINVSPGTTAKLRGIYMVNALIAYVVGDTGKIFMTTNCGANWTAQNSGTDIDLYHVEFQDEMNGLIGGMYGEIIKTTNGGQTWNDPESELTGNDVKFALMQTFGGSGYSAPGDTIMIGGGNGFLAQTTNGGVNWNLLNSGTVMGLKDGYFVNNNTGWIIGNGTQGNNVIIKTTNSGSNWVQQSSTITDSLKDVHFINETTGIIVGNAGKIIRTTNAGTLWAQVTSGTTQNFNCVDFTDQNTGVAIGVFARRTTNGGLNWSLVSTNTASTMYDFSFGDANTGIAVGQTGTIIRTTNAGVSFELRPLGQFNHLYAVQMVDANTGYTCGGYDLLNLSGVFKTTNGGINWIRQNSGTNNFLYGIVFSDAITGIVVGEGGSILKTTTGGTPIGIQQISNEAPHEFLLMQNYPNPFNPQTVISFQLAVYSYTKLKIYDILGREVTTLVNEQLSPGTYEVDFDGSKFSSGIYFYTLSSASFTETKKMVLIK